MKNKAITLTIVGLLVATVAGVAAALIATWLNIIPQMGLVVESLFVAVFGALVIILAIEIVSAINIDSSTIHTALIAGCLVALYAFSADMHLFFADLGTPPPIAVYAIASEIAFVLTTVCCCWYIKYLCGVTLKKTIAAAITVLTGVLLAAYVAAYFFGYGYVVHFVTVVFTTVELCFIMYHARKKKEMDANTYFTAAVFALSVAAQSVNVLFYNDCATVVPGLSLVFAALSFVMFLLVYLRFSLHAHKNAVKSVEYEQQAKMFETRALSGQIKPHFIFNSLEAIRLLYHQDLAIGDEGLNHLSNFLRGSINSFDSELIPFQTELDNIFNFTEFENLKRHDKADVIFDIDFAEFYVPPFSVQPFVENAIKYSDVDKIEGGSIIISSYKSGDYAIVEVTDNGKGFDASKVLKKSHGIKNASDRFALTLGASTEIESEIGQGTRVKIVIDLSKQGERNK